MERLLNIPEREYLVSEASARETVVYVRLHTDPLTEGKPSAFVLQAHGAQDPDTAINFLTRVRENKEFIYASCRGSAVVLTAQDGDEFALSAESFTGAVEPLTPPNLPLLSAKRTNAIVPQTSSHARFMRSCK